MAQWLRVRLPVQGTRVRALVREDPTCHRVAGLVSMVAEPVRPEPVLRSGRGRNRERPTYRKEKKKKKGNSKVPNELRIDLLKGLSIWPLVDVCQGFCPA